MSNTAKDKVTAKVSFNPKKITKELLTALNERGADVVKKRYGLGDSTARMTLEAIGQEYGITRERVRQIENFSIAQIRKSQNFKEIAGVFEEIRSLIGKYGGVVHEKDFFQTISQDKLVQNHIHFFLVLGDEFLKDKEDDEFHHAWVVDEEVNAAIRKALRAVHTDLKEEELISESEMIMRFLGKLKEHNPKGEHNEETARHWMRISKKVGQNPLGEWGMSNSPNIKARGIRDYAYLILRKHGSPMHFREVAKEIAKIFGKHFLDLKIDERRDSYWCGLSLDKKSMEDYYRQF